MTAFTIIYHFMLEMGAGGEAAPEPPSVSGGVLRIGLGGSEALSIRL